ESSRARGRSRCWRRAHGWQARPSLSPPVQPSWLLKWASSGSPCCSPAAQAYDISITPRRTSDLHRRIEHNHPAERHPEELGSLSAVLLHAGKETSLQSSQPRPGAGADYMPPDEERAVLGEDAQAASPARFQCLAHIGRFHEPKTRGD